MMSVFRIFNIASSALNSQKKRLEVISSNIANVNTTRAKNGQPYNKKRVVFEAKPVNNFDSFLEKELKGVEISKVVESQNDYITKFDPSHPDADRNGYVKLPNINVVEEMVDMLSANRSYEANITAIKTAKSIAKKSLELGNI